MNCILITGASSRFGRTPPRISSTRAGRSSPRCAILPPKVGRLRTTCAYCLSTSPTQGSIAAAIAEAGRLDRLVNNAGVGMLNVLEGAEIYRVRKLFETDCPATLTQPKGWVDPPPRTIAAIPSSAVVLSACLQS